MIAILVTLLVVLATLVIVLMNVAFTSTFTGDPPQGERAMALVIPFFGLAGAILVMGVAAVLAAFRVETSALGLIHSSPWVSAVLAVALIFGGALAAGMVFMLWCEPMSIGLPLRSLRLLMGVAFGLFGPIAVGAALIVAVWTTKQSVTAIPSTSMASLTTFKAMFWAVCVQAAVGYGLGGSFLWTSLAHQARNRAEALKAEIVRQRELSEFLSKPREQQLTEELGRFSADSPLWSIIAYLPDQPGEKSLNDECRSIVVARALQAPNVDESLLGCMEGRYYLYRQAAAEFLRSVPEEQFNLKREVWGEALLKGITVTGQGVSSRPEWMSETFDANEDPLGHVRSLLLAAQRFQQWSGYPRMQAALQQLTTDAAQLKADRHREKLLKELTDHGYTPSGTHQ